MSQQKIELSNTPQNLGSNAAQLYYDGSLGDLWVWKSVSNQVALEVSIAG